MNVGCLGDIAFVVKPDLIQTIKSMTWSGGARYATHERHLKNALTEFCGIEPDKFSFEMQLSSDLGADPMTELVKIWAYERNGTPLSLIIGDKGYGKYRWVIQEHKISIERTDPRGNLTWCTVEISLLEYLSS
ncbi:phage tail protein [Bengtsoniella intestinalis]|uniref:phage tail protein n=1 Tax=Bengtsoniella intestinalis TaxID=3073143 RepID=UPI00391F661F